MFGRLVVPDGAKKRLIQSVPKHVISYLHCLSSISEKGLQLGPRFPQSKRLNRETETAEAELERALFVLSLPQAEPEFRTLAPSAEDPGQTNTLVLW